jgi:uncharacterized protein
MTLASPRLRTDLAPLLSQNYATNRVIGSGPLYPFSFTNIGGVNGVATASGLALINSSIHNILSTYPGERVLRPTFGSLLRNALFMPSDIATWNFIKNAVADALATWEKRIQLTAITAVAPWAIDPAQLQSTPGITAQVINSLSDPNTIGINLQYVVLRVNVAGSYIYPFSLEGCNFLANVNTVSRIS